MMRIILCILCVISFTQTLNMHGMEIKNTPPKISTAIEELDAGVLNLETSILKLNNNLTKINNYVNKKTK